MLNSFVEKFNQDGEVYLRIKVRPGARADEVKKVLADEAGEIVKIDIAAPAVRGKANLALMKFLAREFGADKSGVSIISGAGERLKLVKIVK